MANKTSSGYVARTWTDNEAARHYKWTFVFWLSLALITTLVAYIWTRWPGNAVRTFVANVSVADYGLRLPNPDYPEWDLASLEPLQNERALRLWKKIDSTNNTSAGSLRTWLSRLSDQLKVLQTKPIDTIVINLRGHAIVNETGQVVLLFGESPEEKGRNSEIPIQEVLGSLQKLPVANVVILADICDLDYAPQLNVVHNPVPSELQKLCSQMEPAKCKVWMITSKSDNQDAMVSHLLGRTLLQSAAEFALDPRARANGKLPPISLAEFYDRLTRYCDRASEGKQIPILMQVGAAQACRPDAKQLWKAASDVVVAYVSKEQQAKLDKEAKLKEKDQAKPAEKANTNTAAAPATNPPSTDSPPSTASAAASPPLDAVMQFWQTRDVLESPAAIWSPHQFAPHLWRQLQRNFAQHQFAMLPNARSGRNRPNDSLRDELQALVAEMRGASTGSSGELPRAYRAFLADAQVPREAWEKPTVLAKSDQMRWDELRRDYRIYADQCARLPDWIRWVYHHPETAGELDALVDALIETHKNVPRDRAAIDQDKLQSFNVASIIEVEQRLLDSVERELQSLRKLMEARPIQLTWAQERTVQQLLSFPQLRFSSRLELWQLYQKLTVADVDQSFKKLDESSEQVNRGPLENILDAAKKNPVRPEWFTAVSKSLILLDAPETVRSPLNDSEKLKWGVSFAKALRQTSPTSPGIQSQRLYQWHKGCLQSLAMPADSPLPDVLPGIVVPASVSRALVVELANEDELAFRSRDEMYLTLVVKRKDGADVDQCQISWRFTDSMLNTLNAKKLKAANCLSISTTGDTPLTLSTQAKPVSISNKTLRLNCKTGLDTTVLDEEIQIEVQLREVTDTGAESTDLVTLELAIKPQQPDIVDVNVAANSTTPLLFYSDNRSPFKTLRALAIDGATSKFQFELRNFSSETKRCIVKGYLLPGNSINATTLARTRSQLDSDLSSRIQGIPNAYLVSKAVDLPPATLAKVTPVPIALAKPDAPASAPPATGTESATAISLPTESAWLYFRVEEVDAEGKTKEKWPGFSLFMLDGLAPAIREVLTIKPASSLLRDGFRLTVEPNPQVWQNFGINKLLVKAEVTDPRGVGVNAPPLAQLYTPDAAGAANLDLQVDLTKLKVEDMLAHVSIGGYPRAAAYNVENGQPKRISPALGWFESVEAKANNRPALIKSVPGKVQNARGQSSQEAIFPVSDKEGDLVYESLLIKSRVDMPGHARTQFRLVRAANSDEVARGKQLSRDRQFLFRVEPEPDGKLSLTASPRDIQHVLELNAETDGRLLLQIESVAPGETSGAVLATQTLVFDRQPPNPERIVTSDRVIVGGQPFTLRIKPSDDLSGIKEVFMSIDGPQGEARRWDPMDEPIEGKADGNEWVFVLDTEAIVKSQRRSITVVAMSVDSAGNEQKAHDPVSLSIQPAQPSVNGSK